MQTTSTPPLLLSLILLGAYTACGPDMDPEPEPWAMPDTVMSDLCTPNSDATRCALIDCVVFDADNARWSARNRCDHDLFFKLDANYLADLTHLAGWTRPHGSDPWRDPFGGMFWIRQGDQRLTTLAPGVNPTRPDYTIIVTLPAGASRQLPMPATLEETCTEALTVISCPTSPSLTYTRDDHSIDVSLLLPLPHLTRASAERSQNPYCGIHCGHDEPSCLGAPDMFYWRGFARYAPGTPQHCDEPSKRFPF